MGFCSTVHSLIHQPLAVLIDGSTLASAPGPPVGLLSRVQQHMQRLAWKWESMDGPHVS